MLDDELEAWRAKIYVIVPGDWKIIGPFERDDGTYVVAARPVTSAIGYDGSGATIAEAFGALAAALGQAGLGHRGQSN